MERAADFLEDAEDSLGAARDLFGTGRWAKVCFHCHQAAELGLKAALNALGLERRGHDLSYLLEELAGYVREFDELRDVAKVLDQYYIPTRYANAFYRGSAMRHYTREQAERALEYAEEILRRVRQIVAQGKVEEGS